MYLGRHAAGCATLDPTRRGGGAAGSRLGGILSRSAAHAARTQGARFAMVSAFWTPPTEMAHPTERKRQGTCEES